MKLNFGKTVLLAGLSISIACSGMDEKIPSLQDRMEAIHAAIATVEDENREVLAAIAAADAAHKAAEAARQLRENSSEQISDTPASAPAPLTSPSPRKVPSYSLLEGGFPVEPEIVSQSIQSLQTSSAPNSPLSPRTHELPEIPLDDSRQVVSSHTILVEDIRPGSPCESASSCSSNAARPATEPIARSNSKQNLVDQVKQLKQQDASPTHYEDSDDTADQSQGSTAVPQTPESQWIRQETNSSVQAHSRLITNPEMAAAAVLAALAVWTTTEVILAYKNISQEEWNKAKRVHNKIDLIARKTGLAMISRPGQLGGGAKDILNKVLPNRGTKTS